MKAPKIKNTIVLLFVSFLSFSAEKSFATYISCKTVVLSPAKLNYNMAISGNLEKSSMPFVEFKLTNIKHSGLDDRVESVEKVLFQRTAIPGIGDERAQNLREVILNVKSPLNIDRYRLSLSVQDIHDRLEEQSSTPFQATLEHQTSSEGGGWTDMACQLSDF